MIPITINKQDIMRWEFWELPQLTIGKNLILCKMKRINKKVIQDYFGSFFKQYSPIPKELFTKVRDIVDEAECGCCYITTIYWGTSESSVAAPDNLQVTFMKSGVGELVSTSIIGTSPQRVCVPRDTTHLCVNVLEEVPDGGTIKVVSSNGANYEEAGAVDTYCFS